MDTIVYSSCEENVVIDIILQPYNICEREKMASMIGYIVKDGEDWWSVAKKHHVTVDMLKKSNSSVDKDLMIGDKLLIKKCNFI
jgi:LysM repeat protein